MKKGLLAFLISLAVLTAIGFAGYYYGFLGFIYNVMMPGAFGTFPLIVLSMIFGVAAFFSPCTFTVLPAYVSHLLTAQDVGAEPKTRAQNIRRGLSIGLVAALGVITVDLIVGAIIAALGAAAPFAKDPREDIPFILGVRIVAGLLIAFLGILSILGKTVQIPFLHKAAERMNLKQSAFIFGILYNGAALGCTGPILLGLILYALSTGSFTSALTAFVVFAFTMGALMILLTTLVSAFSVAAARKLVPLAPIIKKIAGYVMIFTGLTIAILTLEGNRIFVKIFFPFLK